MSTQVTIKHAGINFTVEQDETVLDAALRHNIDFPYSCYSGICTTCKGKVLSGQVDYGDNEIYGIEPDNPDGEVLFCCAYARTNLEITHPGFEPESELKPCTFSCQIMEREWLNGVILKVILKPLHGYDFHFLPGQYIKLKYGGYDYPLSIATNPEDQYIELHVLDAPYQPLPKALAVALTQHDEVVLHGPLGHAYLRAGDRPIIMVAGGSGIAQMKSMLQHLISSGLHRQVILYWGARQRQYLYLHDQFQVWAKHIPNFSYQPAISGQDDSWHGRMGLIPEVVLSDHSDLSVYDIYIAGPYDMVANAQQQFIACGAHEHRVFSDALPKTEAWD